MAIITPSSVISEVRGSIGTITYSRNKFKAYAKSRVAPTMPTSSFRDASEAAVRAAVLAWQTFSDNVRLQWMKASEEFNTRARLGELKKIDGYQLFIRSYVNCVYAGSTSLLDVAKPTTFPRIFSAVATITDSGIIIDINAGSAGSEYYFLIKATTAANASRMSPNSYSFYECYGAVMSGGSSSLDITESYFTRFPSATISPGQRVFFDLSIVNIRTGVRTPSIKFSAISSGTLPGIVWPTISSNTGTLNYDSGLDEGSVMLNQVWQSGFSASWFYHLYIFEPVPTNTAPDPGDGVNWDSGALNVFNHNTDITSEWESTFDSVGNWVDQYAFFGIQFEDNMSNLSPFYMSNGVLITST